MLEETSDKEQTIWPHWTAAHAHLKDHKLHNAKVPFLMSWLKFVSEQLTFRLGYFCRFFSFPFLDEEESTVIEEPKKMLIIDCRSYGAAFANRAKGGGVECPGSLNC